MDFISNVMKALREFNEEGSIILLTFLKIILAAMENIDSEEGAISVRQGTSKEVIEIANWLTTKWYTSQIPW